MKQDEILTALDEISDKHLKEAEKPPKKKKKAIFRMVVAAVLVVAVGVTWLARSGQQIAAYAVAEASAPRVMERPYSHDYKDTDQWSADYDLWSEEVSARQETLTQAVAGLQGFFTEGNLQFLSTDQNENKLWSPVNAYIGLAMTAELTGGETRQQLLDLFGVEDIKTLRTQVSAVWESVYQDDSHEISVLANSLWLQKGLTYHQEAMDVLAYHYYASVYQAELGSRQANKDIAAWINNNTGNFLKSDADAIELSRETVMALYSTLYFQAKWSNEFSSKNNTEGDFYTPDGTVTAEYMNKKEYQTNYYWGETFAAVNLHLKNGCSMWFILPDEDRTVTDVLEDGTYMDMISGGSWENSKYMKVNLSVPKFDVSSTMDLSNGLKALGATDVFTEGAADFTELTADVPLYLTGANQSVRVQIDEKGVKAAAYIELPAAGSAEPPEEIVDFVLNRPFLFVIADGRIPLFAGCVNQPEN